jgi:hypothetical protein
MDPHCDVDVLAVICRVRRDAPSFRYARLVCRHSGVDANSTSDAFGRIASRDDSKMVRHDAPYG